MTRLCLVRHGQTNWNLEGRYQGQSDVPLNENGRAQARALAWQLPECMFTAVYTSDLQRATETAAILAAPKNLLIISDPRLREINQGEWEGQLINIIHAHYEELWQQRNVDPASVRPPGGETVGEVARRVYAALDDITARHITSSILVVSHGLSLATAICRIRGIPIGQAYNEIPENTSPIWLDWNPVNAKLLER
jgi:broad specificity phosphatase PhoE